MQILLVTDGGMEELEKIMLYQGHEVSRFSVPDDIPPTAESVFGNWLQNVEGSDLVILDDKMKKKYGNIISVINGSSLSLSEAITKFLDLGVKPESLTQDRLVRRRWWNRNGN